MASLKTQRRKATIRELIRKFKKANPDVSLKRLVEDAHRHLPQS